MLLRDASRRSSDRRRSSHGGPSTSPVQSATTIVRSHVSSLDDARKKFESLSPRERSVLRRVAEGYSGVQIARMLAITPKTVDTYKTSVAQKLGFTHRTDYLRFALRLGLIGNVHSQQGAITTGRRS